MNHAEHIRAQVGWLAEEDRITRQQLVEIVQELLEPFVGEAEPEHFERVNEKIHRILMVSDPNRYVMEEDA